MAVHGYQVERTYVFRVDGLDEPVRARVCRDLMPDDPHQAYIWEISHYYRPTPQSPSVAIPSIPHTATAEEAEKLMRVYANSFTALDVTRNDAF